MILLPRGNPVKEHVDPRRVELPVALAKLRQGLFSGDLRFDLQDGAGLLLFHSGRLIGAWYEAAAQQLSGEAALARLFAGALAAPGRLGIYRLAPAMALRIYAVLHGEVVRHGQQLRLINSRVLLEQLRAERLSGCLRVYAGEQVALIFYQHGVPLGFFLDGALDVETTVDLANSIAREAGARVDVVVTGQHGGEELPPDLLDGDKVADLWERAGQEFERRRREQVLAMLQTIARKHLGQIGVPLVETEFAKLAGVPLSAAQLPELFASLAVVAQHLIDFPQIDLMLDEMSKGAHGLLNSAESGPTSSDHLP